MGLGQAFREIRLAKNISMKIAADDVVSISSLSKFENGQSDVSINKLMGLLDNINVTLPELCLIASSETEEMSYEDLITCAMKAYERQDLPYLQQLYSNLLEEFSETKVQTKLYDSVLIEAFIVSLNEEDLSEESSKEFFNYLETLQHWGSYELTCIYVFTHLEVLPVTMMDEILTNMHFKGSLLGLVNTNTYLKQEILFAALSLLIRQNKFNIFMKHLNETRKSDLLSENIYLRLKLNYLEAIYKLKTDRKPEAVEDFNIILMIYENFASAVQFETLKIDVESILQEYE